ncbi:PPE family protein [Rhodococcus globerulus]|uniref:PPE family protein n=1 Tax=Rhodococcus globerulus TaxID=33008 RepID=UPI001F30A4F9|nr:PPE family protein [Rhodococcus globerulus]MCE4266271.1 PPE family protein [Rhodococcus globerulus]
MVGITGVIWYPRGAAPNSAALIAGAGPVPLSVAGGAWTAVSAGLGDTASTVSRVMANLRIGWTGDAADAALAKFKPFEEWAARSSMLAQKTGGKAQVQSATYTVAAIAMPSLPEIAAVETAKLAAYTLGGALTGSAAVAELAAEQLKLRAAAAMETYDSATAPLAVRDEFEPPPSITMSDVAGQGPQQNVSVAEQTVNAFVDPVRTAAAAIASVLSNPAVTAAASQLGAVLAGSNAATTAATAAATTATAGAGAVSAAVGLGGGLGGGLAGGLGAGATSFLSSPLTALTGGNSTGRHATATTAASATTPVGAHSTSTGLSISSADQLTPRAASGTVVNAVGTESVRSDAVRADAVRATPSSAAGPVASGRHAAADDDDTEFHDTPDYLKHFEHFADGRTVITSVIGAADVESRL